MLQTGDECALSCYVKFCFVLSTQLNDIKHGGGVAIPDLRLHVPAEEVSHYA